MKKLPEKYTPCRGCERRLFNCHSTCDEYKAYKQTLNEERTKRYKAYNDDRYFAEKNFAKAEHNLRYKERLKQRKQ